MKPLDGITVIELADYVSGPVCSRFLADMGARVIKIERETGNVWRETGKASCPQTFTDTVNPGYDINNTGKKHISVNLKTPDGIKIMHRLLESADVFVTNMRVQALERLGLDYPSLKEKYPKLIYGIGLGYGEKGPDANLPAFDHTAFWSRTGFLLDCSPKGDGYTPVFPPSSMGDNFTGLTLALEIVTALFNRTRTGEGDFVKSSLFHNGIFALGAMIIASQKQAGAIYPNTRANLGVAYGDFKCSDGRYVYVASGYAEKLINKVFTIIGRQDLIENDKFNSSEARNKNADELYEILSSSFLNKSSDEWLKIGKELDIPIIKMKHFSEVTEDEQALANGYFDSVLYPDGKYYYVPTSPIEMESLVKSKTTNTPNVGKDTIDVLRAINFSDDDIEKFLNEKVISK